MMSSARSTSIRPRPTARITTSSPAARPASWSTRTGSVTWCFLETLLIALRFYQDVKATSSGQTSISTDRRDGRQRAPLGDRACASALVCGRDIWVGCHLQHRDEAVDRDNQNVALPALYASG